MRLYDVVWNENYVAKIAEKHRVTTDEVEQVLFSKPHVRRIQKGKVRGEHLYVAYGQTAAGRYLVVFFIRKLRAAALPFSARDVSRRSEITSMSKKKRIEPIPEEFSSYAEAADFWDTHDTMDYPGAFRTVRMVGKLRSRHYEIAIDADVLKALKARAHRTGTSLGHLASKILRQQLRSPI